MSNNKREGKLLEVRKCDNCGEDVEIRHKARLSAKHTFCSQKCKGEYTKENTSKNCECYICHKKFHRKPSAAKNNKHNVCSKDCLKELQRMMMTGENNHQYNLKGERNSSWRSNEKISFYGYKLIRCLEHPFRNSDDFVFEHRLVAEKYLLTKENSIEINGQRYLSPDYDVHHIDFNRLNNDKNNLYVLKKEEHIKFHNSLNSYIRDDKGRFINIINGSKNFSKEQLKEHFYNFIK